MRMRQNEALPSATSADFWRVFIELGMLMLGLVTGILLHPSSAPAPALRTVINSPEKAAFNPGVDSAGEVVRSPNGPFIVFSAAGPDATSLAPEINPLQARPLSDAQNAHFPYRSPDNCSVGFFPSGSLNTIDVMSSAGQEVCDVPGCHAECCSY